MSIALAFATLALFLSAVGIYGVLSYLVTQRRREIGIRMALGSTRDGIVGLVLKEGFALVGLGLLVGFVGAIGLRGVIAAQIYGIRVLSPEIILSVAALLGAVALVACVLPARRAMQVEPAIVLNDQ